MSTQRVKAKIIDSIEAARQVAITAHKEYCAGRMTSGDVESTFQAIAVALDMIRMSVEGLPEGWSVTEI